MRVKFIQGFELRIGTVSQRYNEGAVVDPEKDVLISKLGMDAKWLIDNGLATQANENPRWHADVGDGYWTVTGLESSWKPESGESADDAMYQSGNYFKEKEDAEAYAEYLKARSAVLEDAKISKTGSYYIDGKDIEVRYAYINSLSSDGRTFTLDEPIFIGGNAIEGFAFDTKADAEDSLKNHRDAWTVLANYNPQPWR
ncbi:MAG: hypothetical protein Q4C83_01060 [Candidatus Saccharibacteria bacterium]|nr:hypothetical protein [Candidatus Saccharibacteria bacterium]